MYAPAHWLNPFLFIFCITSYFRLYNKLRERTKITYFMIAAIIKKKNKRNTVIHVKVILVLR
jgi:hypothetical protein